MRLLLVTLCALLLGCSLITEDFQYEEERADGEHVHIRINRSIGLFVDTVPALSLPSKPTPPPPVKMQSKSMRGNP